jgi:hypothetical protein
MRKIIMLFCFAPILMSHTCEDDDHYRYGHPCTDEARAGLNVAVTLDGSSNITSDGISVTARDGNYIEDLLVNIPDTPVFSGAYERVGDYTVTVSKQGYQTYVSNTIAVTHDECHVIPRQLTVNLTPNP